MDFDVENFGLGLLVGWATAYAVFRTRHQLRAAWEGARNRVTSVEQSATRGADSRYIGDLTERCETAHLAGRFLRLSDIVVEPRFLPPAELAAPPENDVVRSVYRVVPNIPDHPYLQAPYNIETLSISELATGANALALLGLPGSGRTTALQAIALHSLGKIRFEPPMDAVQKQLDAEEARLAEKERAVRVQERVVMEQRAKERLANEVGQTFSAGADEEQKKAIPLFNRLMPVYIHFADLLVAGNEFGAEADPSEYLVRAVQANVSRVTASTIPPNLYARLNRGQILLLLDGFDELPESEQAIALAWLRAFREQYGKNFLIVAGPATGYGPLLQVGLTPTFMRPWSDLEIRRVAERWAEAWPQIGKGRHKAAAIDPEAVARAHANARALSPLEVTLKIWAMYAQDIDGIGIDAWLRAYFKRHISNVDAFQNSMALLAALQLEEGFISSERLQALAIVGDELPPVDSKLREDPGLRVGHTDIEKRQEALRRSGKPDSETTSAQGRLLGVLRDSGLLIRHRDDRYTYRHPLLAAYLASLALNAETLPEKAELKAWQHAMPFAALRHPLDTLVGQRMRAVPDLLLDNLVEMACWLAYASPDVEWRGPLLNTLGNQMIAPTQYPLIRERVTAALIDTRDKAALLIFRRAARNMDIDMRRLACLGMGALGDAEGLRDLTPLLNDQDAGVQIAAAMALGAIGTEDALRPMVVALTSGAEQVRQTVAEAFAALPEAGYPTLYDAVSQEDFLIRRAAIFGLRRLRTTWALVAIYRTFLEDDQWYVRSAAQQAFQELTYGRSVSLTNAYPKPEVIPWLQDWASQRGEPLAAGEAALQMLLRALKDGEAPIRALAASNLGQLGIAEAMRALYAALRDGREEVRATAHAALAELQLQIGARLPAPVWTH